MGPYSYRATRLRGARSSFRRTSRSKHRFVIKQQAFVLEQELKLNHSFRRTPFISGCFKSLQHGLPWAVGAVRGHLSNERHSLGCVAQQNWRAATYTQLRINWKFKHGQINQAQRSKFQDELCFLPGGPVPHCIALSDRKIEQVRNTDAG